MTIRTETPAGEAKRLDGLAVVTVTYDPDLDVLRRQLDEVPAQCLHVIVDNATKEPVRQKLQALAATYANVTLELLPKNLGLAAGLNRGIELAIETRPETEWVLLLDQDTEPGADGVARLLAGWRRAATLDPQTGCVGPRLVDARTGLEHGFHQIRGWRWTRSYPPADAVEPVPVASVNGSGTLMSVKLWRELGGLDESLFIDHVDTEWSFRVRSKGYALYGFPSVAFRHRMGTATLRFWLFGWKVWPYRSPARHFYLFRNAVGLMRRRNVPAVWKIWAVPKLLATLGIHGIADPDRRHQLFAMLRGMYSGGIKPRADRRGKSPKSAP